MILYPHSRQRIGSRGLISFSPWHSAGHHTGHQYYPHAHAAPTSTDVDHGLFGGGASRAGDARSWRGPACRGPHFCHSVNSTVSTHTLQCRRFAHAWSKYCMRARAAARSIHIEFAASKKVKRRIDNLGFVADYSGLGQLDSLVSGILLSIVTTSASHERSPASERQFCAAFIHC